MRRSLLSILVIFALASCAAGPQVLSKNDDGIILRAGKEKTDVVSTKLRRRVNKLQQILGINSMDQEMAAMAQSHCSKVGKNSVMTLINVSQPNFVIYTYECR